MSEKRFTATDRFRQFGLWCFDEEQDKYLDATSMVLMLNEQEDKITELEIELTDCKNRKEQSEYNLRRENEQLREEYAESLADEVKKNGLLNEELNQLRIENMRLKKKRW